MSVPRCARERTCSVARCARSLAARRALPCRHAGRRHALRQAGTQAGTHAGTQARRHKEAGQAASRPGLVLQTTHTCYRPHAHGQSPAASPRRRMRQAGKRPRGLPWARASQGLLIRGARARISGQGLPIRLIHQISQRTSANATATRMPHCSTRTQVRLDSERNPAPVLCVLSPANDATRKRTANPPGFRQPGVAPGRWQNGRGPCGHTDRQHQCSMSCTPSRQLTTLAQSQKQ